MKLVEVEWTDSSFLGQGWVSQEFTAIPASIECSSMGYLTKEDGDYIVLTPHWSPECVAGVMAIPKIAIKSMVELKITRKKWTKGRWRNGRG